MKWITLLLVSILLSACTYLNTQLAENPQVVAAPDNRNVSWVGEQPIDVTTTVVN
jgi:hypothetical protein